LCCSLFFFSLIFLCSKIEKIMFSVQRVTATLLLPLVFAMHMIGYSDNGSLVMKVVLFLLFFVGLGAFAHLSVGLHSIMKDYVHNKVSLEFAEFLIVICCVMQAKVAFLACATPEFHDSIFGFARAVVPYVCNMLAAFL
jgi:succinate dehydrogenase hydrophobic anchor subunit